MKSTEIREEMVVALFGEAADLLKRLETLEPVMDEARRGLAKAARDLAAQIEPLRARMHTVAADEQYKAVHYVREQVEQTSLFCREQQVMALKDAGRAVLKEEVGKTLQQLIAPLHEIVMRVNRRNSWLTHVTAAVVSAASTACLLMYLLPRK